MKMLAGPSDFECTYVSTSLQYYHFVKTLKLGPTVVEVTSLRENLIT
jgi:hypothetical protein